MEWWGTLLIIFALLLAFLLTGVPVAFAFMSVNIIGFFIWFGHIPGLYLLVPTAYSGTANFGYVAIPLYVLMGEVLFHTGLASMMIDNMAKWVGKVPGILSLLGVAGGTIFAMMSGSSVGATATFGAVLTPEMRRRGYQNEMIYGPIMAAGSLAVLIPPSVITVLVATVSQQSVGKLLIASVVPGFILSALYVGYILVRGYLQPHLMPVFTPPKVTWGERMVALATTLPLALIIFVVLGLVFFGVATPSESAALGATSAIILAAAYGRLSWSVMKKALLAAIGVTVMLLMIFMSASAFSQLLAFTGVIKALSYIALSAPVPSIVIIIIMQAILAVLGMFIDDISMIMITIPLFFPIIRVLGFSDAWFGILLLVQMELGSITPPFGLLLFTMKGVVPGSRMEDIYRSALPFCLLVVILLILILIFPQLATWLPNLML
ncbi:TRAP transporter large permease subunit [Chloroflexota bacterium]